MMCVFYYMIYNTLVYSKDPWHRIVVIARTGGFVYVCMDHVAYDKSGNRRNQNTKDTKRKQTKNQKAMTIVTNQTPKMY